MITKEELAGKGKKQSPFRPKERTKDRFGKKREAELFDFPSAVKRRRMWKSTLSYPFACGKDGAVKKTVVLLC